MDRKKHFKRGLIVILLGLCVLIAAEGFARIVLGLGTPPLTVADPEIEYLFRPNQDVMRFGNRQLYNAYSMRSADLPLTKPEGEYRILCFGDSILNGGNLTDHENLATTLLEGSLAEVHDPVRVCNVSAGSWGPANMAAYARRFGLFDADYIVVQVSSHDMEDIPAFEPINPISHPTNTPCCALWEGIYRYLPNYIPAMKPLFHGPVTEGEPGEPEAMEDREVDPRAKAITLDALAGIHAMAKEQAAGFVLVLHSERGEVLSDERYAGYNEFLEWVAASAVDVIILHPYEQESLRNGIDPYRENDPIHLSDEGQRILADRLYDFFLEILQ